MTIRTIDHSDQWNDFRTNDPLDYRPVGLLTIRTSARFSDQWTVGPTTIRNIELSPFRLHASWIYLSYAGFDCLAAILCH